MEKNKFQANELFEINPNGTTRYRTKIGCGVGLYGDKLIRQGDIEGDVPKLGKFKLEDLVEENATFYYHKDNVGTFIIDKIETLSDHQDFN